jgi:predicted DsbA family dithiol-disulfide isomerase
MLKANIPLVVGIFVLAISASAQSENDVVVEVGGHKFTLADIEQKETSRLLQAQNTYYQAQKSAIKHFIDDQLLAQKAAASHITVDELVKRDITSQVVDPTEEQLKFLYDLLGSDQPYEKMRSQLLDQYRQQRTTKIRAEYMRTLASETNVVISFLPPGTQVSLEGAPRLGSAKAAITVVEYADYECPYCQQVYPALQKLEKEYDGKLSVVFKDCPLPMHPHAKKAAEAANCAKEQGKFWEYNNTLFENPGKLDTPQLKDYSKALGLNTTEFDKCLDSGAETAKVEKATADAQSLGISGTPSFFINGHFYNGAMKYETLRDVVEQELAAASAQHTLKASN